MKRISSINRITRMSLAPRLALCTMLAALAASATGAEARQGTVPVDKAVPASVQTTKAPDTDPHYQVLDGTHFSYRCHVPYTLKTGDAAIEVKSIP